MALTSPVSNPVLRIVQNVSKVSWLLCQVHINRGNGSVPQTLMLTSRATLFSKREDAVVDFIKKNCVKGWKDGSLILHSKPLLRSRVQFLAPI